MQERTKILVAEVDQAGATTLLEKIRNHGWEAVTTSDAGQAVSLALRHSPSAVVLGPRLAGGGCIFVIKQLRANPRTAHLPVVVRRQSGGAEAQVFLTAGADDCGSCFDEVLQALERHLGTTRPVEGPPAEFIEDPERLKALHETGLLDSPPSQPYDSLTQLGAALLDVPASLVSLVDKDRQFFKSQRGLPEPFAATRQTQLSHSFCQWVVSSSDELVVIDARKDPTLQQNKAVTDLNVVAYAGVPLMVGKDQHPVGSFCAVDKRPRDWTKDELESLRDLGQIARAYLALEPWTEGAVPPVPASLKALAPVTVSAMRAAIRILRRGGPKLGVLERDALFEILDEQTQNLEAACW